MFSDVLAALRHATRVDAIAVVTSDYTAETLSLELATVLPDDAQAGQSDAAEIGIGHAIAAGYERALLAPGDTPLIDPGDIDLLHRLPLPPLDALRLRRAIAFRRRQQARPEGEVRLPVNPHSTLYNTDGQIFSDAGVPVVLFMEDYDINRKGYHDTEDTLGNIDLDYGSALAAVVIETVARVAALAT